MLGAGRCSCLHETELLGTCIGVDETGVVANVGGLTPGAECCSCLHETALLKTGIGAGETGVGFNVRSWMLDDGRISRLGNTGPLRPVGVEVMAGAGK